MKTIQQLIEDHDAKQNRALSAENINAPAWASPPYVVEINRSDPANPVVSKVVLTMPDHSEASQRKALEIAIAS